MKTLVCEKGHSLADFAIKLVEIPVPTLREHDVRADVDLRNEKIDYKVREHSLAHVPLILAAGQRGTIKCYAPTHQSAAVTLTTSAACRARGEQLLNALCDVLRDPANAITPHSRAWRRTRSPIGTPFDLRRRRSTVARRCRLGSEPTQVRWAFRFRLRY
jgi:hypothetical protein